jgi:transcriptional regulator GlxA family with amidase domain
VFAPPNPRSWREQPTASWIAEPPGQYVERIRTEAARRQLEQTHDTVVMIAAHCGFGTAETMRRSFIRRIGIAPDHYRRAYA